LELGSLLHPSLESVENTQPSGTPQEQSLKIFLNTLNITLQTLHINSMAYLFGKPAAPLVVFMHN
jgi:hypothetical protein